MAATSEIAVQTDEDLTDALRINPFLTIKDKRAPERPHPQQGSDFKPLPQKVVKRLSTPVEEECYVSERSSRGMCLIFEHDVFSPNLQLSGRAGSEVDLKSISRCFANLGFEVHIHKNLNYADVANVLYETATTIDHSKLDGLVVFLLSHGNMGTIYAYDAPYPTQKLWEPFTADKAPTLAGKPKIFFLQACQGSQMDEGVRMFTETDSAGFASYKVPIHSDFLISHSTMSGYYSWRNTSNGSWFIQSLVHILEKETDRDLVSILTLVSQRVSKEYESMSSRKEFNNKKQTPFFYSTLCMKLYWDK